MSYLDWKAGDKVVCIDGGIIGWVSHCDVLPEEGIIYTIRAILPWTWGGIDMPEVYGLGIWLQEIIRPLGPVDDGQEQPYGIERFRPLLKRATSIEVFKQLLISTKQPVERIDA